ncbi:hypothetical protein H4R33_003736 [Dimargaris cristalligena]|nr:hypothetical protein H4R33_003736 [Dimargaris cristalligena]
MTVFNVLVYIRTLYFRNCIPTDPARTIIALTPTPTSNPFPTTTSFYNPTASPMLDPYYTENDDDVDEFYLDDSDD